MWTEAFEAAEAFYGIEATVATEHWAVECKQISGGVCCVGVQRAWDSWASSSSSFEL